MAGHSVPVLPLSDSEQSLPTHRGGNPARDARSADFADIYQTYFDFVWRSLRRLGVIEHELDDVAQEVFLVVHKRLDDFEGRSSVRTWLFGIVLRVASQHRRTARRRPEHSLPADLPERRSSDPHEATVQAQTRQLVYELLDELDYDKRVVLVLAELEQMTAPEIAESLSLSVNTVYSRLRAARREFEAALHARRTRDARRSR
jgi:RNA polymerase sigma-70 factor (ECF subfamily)